MRLYFAFALLAILLPLVIVSILVEMNILRLLLTGAFILLVSGAYYISSSDWLLKWSSTSNILISIILAVGLLALLAFLSSSRKRKRIESLNWDESVDIEHLTFIVRRYLSGRGWKVIKLDAPTHLRLERGKTKFAAIIYTSDMPRFYDSEKICNLIVSDTREVRLKQQCRFAVITMLDLADDNKETLSSNKIDFVFYRNLENFLGKL